MGDQGGEGHIIFVTQLLDETNTVLGFVRGWVEQLTHVFARTTVVANEVCAVPQGLDADIVSLGKEDGAGRAVRTTRYLRAINRLCADRPAMVLAHMCPDYANLAAPLARPRGVPVVLWFAHPSVTPELRLANRLCTGVMTSLPGSYPLTPPRLWRIGQATPMDLIPASPSPSPGTPLKLLALGRTSPAKGFSLIIDAAADARAAGVDCSLTIVGSAGTDEERRHADALRSKVRNEAHGDWVRLREGVSHEEVPALIADHHVLVNAMVAGSGDKVVFEAMASGRPVLVSNPSFADVVDPVDPHLRYAVGDRESLVRATIRLAQRSPQERDELGVALRAVVERDHSLEHWGGMVAEVFRALDGAGIS